MSAVGSSSQNDGLVITAASVLVTKPHEFGLWAAQVKLDYNIKETIPTDSSFDPIRDIQRASKIIPQWVSDKNSPPLVHLAPRYSRQIDAIRDSLPEPASSANAPAGVNSEMDAPEPTTVAEDPDLCMSIAMILETSRHHERIMRRLDLPPNETELRISIDNMANHIYDTDNENVSVSHTIEQRLKLPKTSIPNVSVLSITPGAVDMMMFPALPLYRDYIIMREASSCLYQAEVLDTLAVIHCVTVYKGEVSGQHQTLMGIVAGLYQRRALGLPNQFVFGVFQYLRNFLRVVAATWQGEMIRVYHLGTYSLQGPSHTLEFYLLLRGIKRLGDSYYRIIQQEGQKPNPSFVQNASSIVWAPYAASSHLTPNSSTIGDVEEPEEGAPEGSGISATLGEYGF